ncbi:hypothetical protein L798_04459 [Zootermopsis nevadensis]|uniref:Uncharacterized protein n=1 Tax=Zootermopsis nevadensis TaxID=136037 RepID=A0A067QQ17_ZOONE|nr:hypothetical protein L798_04459 [Zootermopsis nevadensis]
MLCKLSATVGWESYIFEPKIKYVPQGTRGFLYECVNPPPRMRPVREEEVHVDAVRTCLGCNNEREL